MSFMRLKLDIPSILMKPPGAFSVLTGLRLRQAIATWLALTLKAVRCECRLNWHRSHTNALQSLRVRM
jgi:hypothetical protein